MGVEGVGGWEGVWVVGWARSIFGRWKRILEQKKEKSPTRPNFEIFGHDPQQYDFQNYTGYACFKSELLDEKKKKSLTPHNFEVFDQEPQHDIKFWNP